MPSVWQFFWKLSKLFSLSFHSTLLLEYMFFFKLENKLLIYILTSFSSKLKNTLVKTFCDLCHRFWSNWDLDTFGPSKWPSAPKFYERYLCSWQKMARNGCKMAKRKSCLLFKFPVFSWSDILKKIIINISMCNIYVLVTIC